MEWLALLQTTGLIEALLGALGIVATYLVRRASNAIEKSAGVKVEKNDREALHSAIMTAVEAALQGNPNEALDEIKRKAWAYANKSIPEVLTRMTPGDGVLDTLVVRYYRKALKAL